MHLKNGLDLTKKVRLMVEMIHSLFLTLLKLFPAVPEFPIKTYICRR